MLKRNFEPQRDHRYVRYARMSTEMQNPRSPEQQFDNIDLTMRNHGRSWSFVGDYRDDGISGRFIAKRPGFRRMLEDLKSGRVKADLILVDTFERFGRSEEIAPIRQELQTRHAILVLTADSGFSDPTSPSGRVMAMFESVRANEDNRIKAHNVLRGKRDLASRKRWPGGPVPLGFRLESIVVERDDGRREVVGSTLVPDPATRAVPARIFALSREMGWGSRKVARALNDDPSLPAGVKPISDESVRICLANTLYMGVLTYGKCCTGIVGDRYVRERVEPGEEMVVEGFCEPIVSREVFEAVGAQRRARNEARRKVSSGTGGPEGDDGGEALPEARKYLLTGLVRCGDCGGAMDLSSTRAKGGPKRSYQYYRCRRQATGRCENREGVREELLRGLVVAKLRWRLFPPPEGPGSGPSWLGDLAEEIRREVAARAEGGGDPRVALKEEFKRLEAQARGWLMSLGNAELAASIRRSLEVQLATNAARRDEIERQLADLEATRERLEAVLDEEAVLDRLRRLEGVLGSGNVSEGNLELRRVVERVACHSDGRVELRTHRHGLFEGSTAWMYPETSVPDGRKRVGDEVANDGRRYWTDPVEFVKPKRASYPSWAREHAREVEAKRDEMGWNVKRLAEHFGKCRETIDRALEHAASPPPQASAEG